MKPAPQMQQIITAIAAKDGLDLAASTAHLRLTMPGYDRLMIEQIGAKQISVAHYFEQNDDAIADPDIVFFMDEAGWIPIEISQVFGYQRVAFLRADGECIIAALPDDQVAVAVFADDWAQAIREQRWLEDGDATSFLKRAA
jgi:hypothetical protein